MIASAVAAAAVVIKTALARVLPDTRGMEEIALEATLWIFPQARDDEMVDGA